MNLGIAGEFRCVVLKEDGSIKEDTGYQRNLLLDQGLEFFGGNHGSSLSLRLLVGSGNSTPKENQTSLDSPVKVASSTTVSSDYSYVDGGDGLYKFWEEKVYRFTDIANVNISELGLASSRSSSSSVGVSTTDYYLTTRALIKNLSGNPTTITLLEGEILDVYYKIHKVLDISEKSAVINMTDGDGGSIPYNVKIKGSYVGNSSFNTVSGYSSYVVSYTYVSDAEWKDVTASPSGSRITNLASVEPYAERSYKRVYKISIGLNDANMGIRTISSGNSTHFTPFQVRFGSVEDDSPIPKTASDSFEVRFEMSWGRYSGEL